MQFLTCFPVKHVSQICDFGAEKVRREFLQTISAEESIQIYENLAA